MEDIRLIITTILFVVILLSVVMESVKPIIILLFLTVLGCVAYLIAFKGVNNITDFINEITTIVFPEV
jgi:hypothetical protein